MQGEPKKCTKFNELCDALYEFFSDCRADMVEFYTVTIEDSNFVIKPYQRRD
ncbi:MAG: hypothetical protein NT130_04480 [Candidatus Micrarchaeota archaeon]|nr:hypothetical protein [Candidatus Micrarchaeota archaeon]